MVGQPGLYEAAEVQMRAPLCRKAKSGDERGQGPARARKRCRASTWRSRWFGKGAILLYVLSSEIGLILMHVESMMLCDVQGLIR